MPSTGRLPAERSFYPGSLGLRADDDDEERAELTTLNIASLTAPITFLTTRTLSFAPIATTTSAPSFTTSASPSILTLTVTVLSAASSVSVTTTPKPQTYASAWASVPLSSNNAEQTASPVGGSSMQTNHVPAAAIAVPVVIAVLIMIAFGVLVLRKRFAHTRERRRSWATSVFPFPRSVGVGEVSPTSDREKGVSPTARAPNPTPDAAQRGLPSSSESFASPLMVQITPPPASYNLPPATGGANRSSSTQPLGMVRCTFMPTLPDELSITSGELVRVMNEFDDGWALCENARREQGMVPLECLEIERGVPAGGLNVPNDGRPIKRESSLSAVANSPVSAR